MKLQQAGLNKRKSGIAALAGASDLPNQRDAQSCIWQK